MNLFKYLDHTLLSPTATTAQIDRLCEEAIKYSVASVCIPPFYIEYVRKGFPTLNICTVIGFPLGYSTTASKVFEAENAIQAGADEIDMVINRSMVKNGDFDGVTDEIAQIKHACGNKILKVIIETCDLDDSEKIKLCACVSNSGADYIKTSTGFGKSGAVLSDIMLFKKHLAPNVKIKAAGGIRSKEDMEAFIDAGCSRLGTSSGIKILTEERQ